MRIKEKAFNGEPDEDMTPKVESLPMDIQSNKIKAQVAVSLIDLGNVKNKSQANSSEQIVDKYSKVIDTFSLRHNIETSDKMSEQGQTSAKIVDSEWAQTRQLLNENIPSRTQTQDISEAIQKLSTEDSVLKSETIESESERHQLKKRSEDHTPKSKVSDDSSKNSTLKSDRHKPSKKCRTVRFEESKHARKGSKLDQYSKCPLLRNSAK